MSEKETRVMPKPGEKRNSPNRITPVPKRTPSAPTVKPSSKWDSISNGFSYLNKFLYL